MSYRIDRDRWVVFTEASGVWTDVDILSHKAALLRDPAFDPSMPQISDVRNIERLEVTPAGVWAMVEHDEKHAHRLADHRMSLVVPKDSAFGMARMYQLMGTRDPHIGVFCTMEEADVWPAAQPQQQHENG